MLKVRAEQTQAFETSAMRTFEDEMTYHAAKFSPVLVSVIGEEQMRLAVREMIAKARHHGFTLRGPIRLFVELMLMCGSSFDTDPQFSAIADALAIRGAEMARVEAMQTAHNEYLELVAGRSNVNVNSALFAIAQFARNFPDVRNSDLEHMLLAELSNGFPQRLAYSGQAVLLEIIRQGRAGALAHGFDTPRGQALIIILMSAFGHGCMADPLYPWIMHTLNDPKIVDAKTRADRLERKALTWLDHVLRQISQGVAI